MSTAVLLSMAFSTVRERKPEDDTMNNYPKKNTFYASCSNQAQAQEMPSTTPCRGGGQKAQSSEECSPLQTKFLTELNRQLETKLLRMPQWEKLPSSSELEECVHLTAHLQTYSLGEQDDSFEYYDEEAEEDDSSFYRRMYRFDADPMLRLHRIAKEVYSEDL